MVNAIRSVARSGPSANEHSSLFGAISYQTFSLLVVVSFGCAQDYLKP